MPATNTERSGTTTTLFDDDDDSEEAATFVVSDVEVEEAVDATDLSLSLTTNGISRLSSNGSTATAPSQTKPLLRSKTTNARFDS